MHPVALAARLPRTILWVLIGSAFGLGAAAWNARASAPADSSRSFFILHFEDSSAGAWRLYPEWTPIAAPLDLKIVPNFDGNNRSAHVLHCCAPEGRESATIAYFLEENGVPPVPLRRRTCLAWNWKVSSVRKSNGFWIRPRLRNVRTGQTCNVQHANWIRLTHDVFVYWDPPLVWRYHESFLFDYVDERFGPIEEGEWVIEDVLIYLSASPGVEVWLDNLWLGEGQPPSAVNVSTDVGPGVVVPSELQGFSYGFIDGDLVPDRVEIYQDRVELIVNPGLRPAASDGEGDRLDGRPRVITGRTGRTVALAPHRGAGAVSIFDADGDRWNDMLLCFDDKGGNRLFWNRWIRGEVEGEKDPRGALTRVGQHHYGSAIADVDGDGRLDVFLCNPFCRRGRFGGAALLRGLENGEFEDWTAGSGVYAEATYAATFGDVNGDGRPDLFVGYQNCNLDDGSGGMRGPTLFINTGGGRYAETVVPLPEELRASGAVFADFDNDADLDLYVVVYKDLKTDRVLRNRLLLNDGNGRFVDYTDESGAACRGGGEAAIAEDFDNDGDVDLYVLRGGAGNVYLRNMGGAVFEDFTAHSSFMWKDACANGVGVDIDMDGDLDVALLERGPSAQRVLTNNMFGMGKSIRVVLRGVTNNSNGLGAGVSVYEGESERLVGFKEMSVNRGFAPSVPPVLHFGIGERSSVDVVVAFPPVVGRESFRVRRSGVRAGETVVISEYRGAGDRILHASLWKELRDRATTAAYMVSLPVILGLVFGSIAGAGIRWRSRVPAVRAGSVDGMVIAVAVMALVAGLLRSWEITAGLAVGALGVVASYRRLARVGVASMPARLRHRLEDFALRKVSDLRHMDAEFVFFENLNYYTDAKLVEMIRKACRSLGHLALFMRVLDPGASRTRLLREEIGFLRTCAAALGRNRDAGNIDQDWKREIADARARIIDHVEGFRSELRTRVAIELGDAWSALVDVVGPDARAAGIELCVGLPAGLRATRILVRLDEFLYVFKNLFYNSLKAVEGGAERHIEVTFEERDPDLLISWSDTGYGVPEEVIDRLANEPVASSWGGSGQGLYSSRLVLAGRGGRILPMRRPAGAGATFEVRLRIVYGKEPE